MKVNESAAIEGCEALQLYVSCLTTALGELAVQARRLHDETNVLANAVADSAPNSMAVASGKKRRI
jgi:uncharacterized membrane protein YhaH (DUF805 family)